MPLKLGDSYLVLNGIANNAKERRPRRSLRVPGIESLTWITYPSLHENADKSPVQLTSMRAAVSYRQRLNI